MEKCSKKFIDSSKAFFPSPSLSLADEQLTQKILYFFSNAS
jgi:hypothetical protein